MSSSSNNGSSSTAEIIYSLVAAQGPKILTECTNAKVSSGNFPRIAMNILSHVSNESDQKKIYEYDSKYVTCGECELYITKSIHCFDVNY